jgi:transcriptional regulator with XRE-family HTH domain
MKCDKCNGTGILGDSRIIGARLRARRKRLRIALKAIAARLQISVGYLSDLEHGRRSWTEERVLHYELALSLEVKK